MTLTDAQVERYSRQLILAEVGARGQERLLAARAAVAGTGPASVLAATLLGRAGVGALDVLAAAPTLPELSPDCRTERHADLGAAPPADVTVDLAGNAAASAALARRARAARRPYVLGGAVGVDDPTLAVLTLVDRPCIACVDAVLLDVAGAGERVRGPLAAATVAALGALAATEALRVLLLEPPRGRVTVAGPPGGAVGITEPTAAGRCAHCGSRA